MALEENDGADIVTSMSVLNVLFDPKDAEEHICEANRILKNGGIAYFKVWAGHWPDRGSGRGKLDGNRLTYQSNQWASYYLPRVAAVFQEGNCFCDNTRNLIIAAKVESSSGEVFGLDQ